MARSAPAVARLKSSLRVVSLVPLIFQPAKSKNVLFLKKRTKKLYFPAMARIVAGHGWIIKVFCFFSSEKKTFQIARRTMLPVGSSALKQR
jgi:hypothetical protein